MLTAHQNLQTPLRTARHGLAAVVVLLLVLVLSGCGIRLETPPPTEPTPDALEVARRAATTDVLAILEVATEVEQQLKDEDPVAETVATIRVASAAHLEQLGGEYDSGLDSEDDVTTYTTPPPLPEQSTTADPDEPDGPTTSFEELVDRLAQAYSRTRGALESVPDPGLARLMASIATFQLTSAQTLATSVDLELPKITVPGTPELPVTPPAGISTSDLSPIILAEDGAGYAYEVLAAHRGDAARVAALARAAVHRSRGNAAATAAQVAHTVQDPRRTAYEIPGDPTKKSYVRQLELNLAASYATMIGLAAEDERVTYLDLMIDSYHAAQTWGAKPVMFPGLTEQQD